METNETNHSHLSNIRKLLLGGSKLTVLSVLKLLRTIELRHYIAILRKEGMNIKDEWKTSESGKRYKIYWLEK